MEILKALSAATAAIVAYGLFQLFKYLLSLQRSPLRKLPGPPASNPLFGSFLKIAEGEHMSVHKEWDQKYGHVYVYKNVLMMDRMYTTDMRAINHILTHSMDYQKPEPGRWALSRILGNGILVAEGDKHRQQRRIMNPAFAPSTIKEYVPTFFSTAQQLSDVWRAQLAGKSTPQRIDMMSWLSRATLDIIGLTGFGYRFESLANEKPSKLNDAFFTLFSASGSRAFNILQFGIPLLRRIPTARSRMEATARQVMKTIGEGLLHERQMRVRRERGEINELVDEKALGEKGNDLEETIIADTHERDLLSVLVKANMDTELPENQRMSDEDVIAQVPTFLLAGHETTSTETMWCLFELAQHPEIQTALRKEARATPLDGFDSKGRAVPSAATLNALPLLDSVVRETLRLHAAVHATTRVAMRDDVIPLAKPFIDRYGVQRDSIKIGKGESILIPILRLHRSEEIWGKDAEEFNPERWNNPPEAVKDMPGVWGNLLTFLGGSHSCIGYRFALNEMKALLFVLLRDFEFALAEPAEAIETRAMIVARPYLRSNKHGPSQMPLMVRVAP